jgi:PAS domain S-box-containing protein
MSAGTDTPLLCTLLETVTDGILVLAVDGSIRAVNRAFAGLWSLPPVALAGADPTALYRAMAARLADGEQLPGFGAGPPSAPPCGAERADARVLCLRGGRVLAWWGACLDLGGEPLRLWTFRDQSVQHAAEQALRVSEQRLHDILHTIGDWVWELDVQWRFSAVSEGVERVLGYRPEELLGKRPFDLMPPDEAVRMRMLFSRSVARAESFQDLENINLHRDGSERHILTSGVPVRDLAGRLVGYRGADKDVTDRRRIERELDQYRYHLEELVAERTAELEAANERLRLTDLRLHGLFALSQEATSLAETALLSRGAEIAVRLCDSLIGRVDLVEPQTSRLVPGGGWGEGLGLVVPEADTARDSDGTEVWTGALTSAGPAMRNRGEAPARVGRHSPWQPALAVPVVEGGTVRLVLSVGGRLADYGEVQVRELELIGNDLWLILTRRRVELALAEAKEQAELANRAKSEFLANMSHEIRTPLNAIVGLTHLLQEDLTEPHQRAHIEKVAQAAAHLLAIVNDILDLSKIEAGRLQLGSTDFRLEELLEQVLTLIRPRAEAKGVALSADLARLPPLILRGDPLRLRQVLVNLLANAVKFTDRGSVLLMARVSECDTGSVRLHFEVVDTGVGIDPAAQERLFAPFEQVDGSLIRRHGGTGLGLAICRRLITAMGGNIGVESRLGAGSTFWFTVRLSCGQEVRALGLTGLAGAEAEAVGDRRADAERPTLAGVRTLVVEDDPINREVALALLVSVGVVVDLAEDGAQAVERCAAMRYDLVLMDLEMPVMDGLEATRRIRAMPDYQTVPILAMTASAFREDRERCLAAGMSDHVAKPVDPDRLYRTLASWLRREPPAGRSRASWRRRALAERVPEPVPPGLAAVPGVNARLGMRSLGGNRQRYLELLRDLAVSHQGDGARVRELLAGGAAAAAHQLAHGLKGVSGTLGAVRIQALAGGLDTLLREGEGAERLSRICESLDRELAGLAAALAGLDEQSLGGGGGTEIPSAEAAAGTDSGEDLGVLLESLEALLCADDLSAHRVCVANRQTLRRHFGDLARQLEELVGTFDFPRANEFLASMRRDLRRPAALAAAPRVSADESLVG